MWWTGLRGWKQMHKASFLFSDVSLCLAPRKLGKDFRPRKDTPSTPLGVWTESISLGKQERAFIEPRSFFISQSGFQPRRYLFTSAPACLIPCFHRSLHTSVFVLLALFIFPPTSSQTSFILPLIDPSRSIQPSAPLSLHQSSCPSLFFSFSLLRTNTPQVGLSPSSISLPALPADSVFAHGLGRALCHWGRKELIRLLFVVAFCVLWREADPPEADAHVHGCTHGEQSENRESDKERSTHTRTHQPDATRHPARLERGCAFAPRLLCCSPFVYAHACSHTAPLLPLFPGQACFLIGSLMCGIQICVIPHQQRLWFDKFCFPCCHQAREVTAATWDSCAGEPLVLRPLSDRVCVCPAVTVFPAKCACIQSHIVAHTSSPSTNKSAD